MDSTHKQEFHVRDLPTRSVTLFPTRAQIVRDIKDVALKPGTNEIIVVGLTPTVDEHSIKVEGTGSATITDITVELLPNRDIFEEMYPDSDSESDKDESEEDDTGEPNVSQALEEVRAKLLSLRDEQKRAKEVVASAESRLKILDGYGTSLDRKCSVDIEASVETYRKEREKTFTDHMAGTVRDRELTKEIAKLWREESRLEKLQRKEDDKIAKEKAKVRRVKEKLREKQRRRDAERRKEKARIRREREQFWPRSCYTVRISLDAGANFTPGSSRRSSIASAADVQLVSGKEPKDDEPGASVACDLTLTYVTSSAFWAPSYDLALSTTTNTATLCFDARLTNTTSETWSNTKVTLSTSQASFTGLQDDTPKLVPWRLRLTGRNGPWDGLDIMHSREERTEKEQWNALQNRVAHKPRGNLFGPGGASFQKSSWTQQAARQQESAFQANQLQAPQVSAPRGLFGSAAVGGGSAFGNNPATLAVSAPAPAPPAARSSALFGSTADVAKKSKSRRHPEPARAAEEYYDAEEGDSASSDDMDARTMLDPSPLVTFQDSSFEETGLTATYDLPHTKTLRPSPTASKQRVARLNFTNVSFTRTVVAKYKPAAYLRARLRNTSKLTLLKGPAGLTLDGTFLGRLANLPRCSAGDTFTIPLGVDPAVRVAYPKPEVSRATTGVAFLSNRGETSVYTRMVTLVNTRAAAGRSVSVTVLDQVPVSEDEKLRVEVLQPGGMQVGGRAVACGVQGKEGKEEADWGRATATIKKEGEVAWEVVLNAGKSVKLALVYEVAFPAGERVAQVYP